MCSNVSHGRRVICPCKPLGVCISGIGVWVCGVTEFPTCKCTMHMYPMGVLLCLKCTQICKSLPHLSVCVPCLCLVCDKCGYASWFTECVHSKWVNVKVNPTSVVPCAYQTHHTCCLSVWKCASHVTYSVCGYGWRTWIDSKAEPIFLSNNIFFPKTF